MSLNPPDSLPGAVAATTTTPRGAPQESAASYGQILKSTSLVGGAQGINLVIGLAKTKLVALLLGPTGVGLVGLYGSVTGLVSTVAGLGIASSAVRQVAEAHGTGDQQRIGRTIRVLRRTCWITGLLGTVLSVALAWPLSVWAFGDRKHTGAIAILGVTLLLGSISGGQMAMIQGIRRIGDLARMQVLSALAGAVLSVGLYAWLGQRGIVPVFIACALANLGFSWWFARRVAVPPAAVSWRDLLPELRGLLSLGVAFMINALLAAGLALAVRALILRSFGLEANGIYQASWALSGLFAGFILQAMGADFFPRLTAAAADNAAVTRLVNEQAEVGLLLALPGLLGTLTFSSWIIHIFYSAKFIAAAGLLPWFVLGIFSQVVSWPLGYILLAQGASRQYALSAVFANLLQLALIWLALRCLGLWGVAVGFALSCMLYTLAMWWLVWHRMAFGWSRSVLRLLIGSAVVVGLTFAAALVLPPLWTSLVGTVVVPLSSFYCLRQLLARLGPEHRLSRLCAFIPGVEARPTT